MHKNQYNTPNKINNLEKDIKASFSTQQRRAFTLYKTQVHLISEQNCTYV